MGTGHKFRKKTKYVCMGEGKETLKFDGGEEIKPRGELSYLAPLGSEKFPPLISSSVSFGGDLPPRLSQTPRLPVPRQK